MNQFKKILILCPFDDIYPPVVGGSQRYFHVIHQLSRFFKVSLIAFQVKDTFCESATEYPSIGSINYFSTRDYQKPADVLSILPGKLEKALRYRWIKRNPFATADGNFLHYYFLLEKVLQENAFDVVILENLSSLNAIPIIRKFNPLAKIIYNAHNVDTHLASVGVKAWGTKSEYLSQIEKTERNFAKILDAVITCSKEDRQALMDMSDGKLLAGVVPNGVVIPEKLFNEGVQKETHHYILFCGALWTEPNSEGLNWFVERIWPMVQQAFPELKLLVVGSGELSSRFQHLKTNESLIFTGKVADVKPWYNKSALAIVPLLNGSGTRLKVLEAMGLGVPMVSTSKGAEGILYSSSKEIMIADDPTTFAGAVINLLNNKSQRMEMALEARQLAKDVYDWDIIGTEAATFIHNVVLKND